MKKLLWILKQLLPLKYNSVFTTNGLRKVTIWRQWFGKVLWCESYKIS